MEKKEENEKKPLFFDRPKPDESWGDFKKRITRVMIDNINTIRAKHGLPPLIKGPKP